MSVNLANQLAVQGWKVDLLSPVKGDSSNVDPSEHNNYVS